MTRVMIAIDGTDLDRRLVDVATDLFADADFWAVNVGRGPSQAPPGAEIIPPVTYGTVYPYVSADPYSPTSPPTMVSLGAGRAEEVARRAVDDAGHPEIEAVGEVGDPSEVVAAAVEQHRIDVLVVGTHARSWWSRLFRPSVSAELVDEVDAPVLVVRTSDDEATDV